MCRVYGVITPPIPLEVKVIPLRHNHNYCLMTTQGYSQNMISKGYVLT
ncbi:MAG: Unknown protein [uncultured Sulfurovum sp.]|uniref:Uncharacterized protein n=1 Tax=uncultured Sulfurovum sp. TaxID=269237 RepID=A0A6S6U312_9BACT|nr:MAG: Unknown protein [uncultured Sulfurovum sp.]